VADDDEDEPLGVVVVFDAAPASAEPPMAAAANTPSTRSVFRAEFSMGFLLGLSSCQEDRTAPCERGRARLRMR
jgi:hypothetical protein